ncbi:hypothetical protein PQR67_15775 [Paraburkholderia fungorum]|uniref:hypothetical protein n=1 Tax=Paraburkholderia fungorum TaxID=134537 RepID=UPI0038B856CF
MFRHTTIRTALTITIAGYTAARSVTGIVSEISEASDGQSHGIDQINASMTQMDNATQQNAALVEQAAVAAASLEDQARARAVNDERMTTCNATRHAGWRSKKECMREMRGGVRWVLEQQSGACAPFYSCAAF